MRIVHATSVHPRGDTRITLKMCRSAVRAGYETFLVVADGLGAETRDGVSIEDVGMPGSRRERAILSARKVLKAALAKSPDIVHFHDPELLPHAAMLRRKGGPKLIFDAHEDVPLQLLGKHYLPTWSRRLVSRGYTAVERMVIGRVDTVIAATPAIAERYRTLGSAVECVANFPWLGELVPASSSEGARAGVCYVGGLTRTRGLREVVDALALTETKPTLSLGGRFEQPSFRMELAGRAGWPYVRELGFLDRGGVRRVYEQSVAGVVVLQATPNYVESLPVKMFEYMSAGIPVIASHFPLWREIIEGNECGICVDPTDPGEIATAIDTLVGDPDLAARLGRNGRQAVETKFSWESQEPRLIELYERLLREGAR